VALLFETEVLLLLGCLLPPLQKLLLVLALLPPLLHPVERFLDLLGVVVAGVGVDLGVVEGGGEGALLHVCVLALPAQSQRLLLVLQVSVVVVELEGLLLAESELAVGHLGALHRVGQGGRLEGALVQLLFVVLFLALLLLDLASQVVEDEQVSVRDHSVSRDAVVQLRVVL
jgi:hypothetical protein